jgi:hypothetical protein
MEEKNERFVKKSLVVKLRLFFKTVGRDFFYNPLVFWLIFASLVVNLANWLALWFFTKAIDSAIILHYNVYFGVDMIGDRKIAFFMPAIGLFLLISNVFFGLFFYHQKERVASYILLLAALMIQFSLLIASISVIIINY